MTILLAMKVMMIMMIMMIQIYNCDDCDCHCGCEGCDYIAGLCCDDDHVYDDHVYDDEDDGSSADVVLMMVMTNTHHVYIHVFKHMFLCIHVACV